MTDRDTCALSHEKARPLVLGRGAGLIGSVLKIALLIIVVASLGLVSGCSSAVCLNQEVHRYPAPEHGAKAVKMVYKCGQSRTEQIIKSGSPACLESCFK